MRNTTNFHDAFVAALAKNAGVKPHKYTDTAIPEPVAPVPCDDDGLPF